ncbi:MAG: SAM-dependent methyltransferase [Clostridia bacterium]|nr:MAG: SAM-dependent methyltransferase [Clostridia bacterium]
MNRKQVQKQFGDNAERYVSSRVHAQGTSLTQMVRLAQPQPHWLVLDVATGGGHAALAIARQVHSVVALDVTLPMLQAARAFTHAQGQHNISWVQADGATLPFGENLFDLITCRVALHHFPDQAAAIKEWARCLKPGGRLMLVDNIGPQDKEANAYINAFEKLRDPSHGHLFPLATLTSFLENAGLQVFTSSYLRKPMLFYPWMERMQVSRPDQERLSRMLWQSAGHARDFLNPQGAAEQTTFELWEGVFMAEKPG